MKIKDFFSKLPLFSIFVFSLPFLGHGSAFDELPKLKQKVAEARGEAEHGEINLIIQKIIRKNLRS